MLLIGVIWQKRVALLAQSKGWVQIQLLAVTFFYSVLGEAVLQCGHWKNEYFHKLDFESLN